MQAWYGYQQVKTVIDAAEAEYLGVEQSLVLRVATAYFNALQAIDTLTTQRAEERQLFHQLEQTRQRFEVGLTAITEVHEAQARYDSAIANTLIAEGNVGITMEAIEAVTGKAYGELAPLAEAFEAAL